MRRQDYINCDFLPAIVTNTINRTFECNTLVFWNQGSQNVTIDGLYTLTPGQAYTYECYPGEMNIRAYDIVFENDRLAGCKLVCILKVYLSTNRINK
jgi:hypothetical protein